MIPDRLILVSKAAISEKRFFTPDQLASFTKSQLKELEPFLPSEDEKQWHAIYNSKSPQVMRLQRKMSVCLDVEVTELEETRITFLYGEHSYTLTEPENSFKLCQILDRTSSDLDGLVEMFNQGCVLRNGEPIQIKALKIDETRLLEKVAGKFFFQIYSH